MADVRVGMFPLVGATDPSLENQRQTLAQIADAGLDHVCVGDHVSFHVGAGRDGLIDATALLGLHPVLPVYVGLYLLPLRHPVPVARQLATIGELAPGRLTLGVGIGGEDRHELEICGVDPRTRGRRMDESLLVLRELLAGEAVTFDGDLLALENALILPAPSPPIPLIVGGRSDAAVGRAARLGDGWLGIWVSTRRFGTVVEQIADDARAAGRDPDAFEHGLNVWCGIGDSRDEARVLLAAGMEHFYRIPFDPFERYSPYGTPAEIVEFLAPYADAGCNVFNLIPCAADDATAIAGCAEIRQLLVS